MSVLSIKNRLNDLLRTVGKPSLHANYPDEFELYLFAFELLSFKGETIQYFIFPDNPQAIKESHPQLNTISKTMSGVSVFSNPTFNPIQISISGTFGRRLRILVGKQTVVLAGQYANDQINSFKGNNVPKKNIKKQFDTTIKTGYGCMKILQNIVEESKLLDNGKPRTLLFYNLASGNSFVVKIMSFDINQNNKESNMLWQYDLKMVGVAPADTFSTYDFENFKSVQQQLAVNQFAQERANNVVTFINKFVNVNDVFRNGKLLDALPKVNNIYDRIGPGGTINGEAFSIFG